MPRVSDVYSLPATYLAATGEIATATQHNAPLEDLETDANAARPVSCGGTGATVAADARTNLDVPSNSEAVLVTGAQTVAGAKTFSDNAAFSGDADVTGDVSVGGTITGDVIGDILDTNGNELIEGVTAASAVNYLQVLNSATGNNVELQAAGDDTNIALRYNGKGTGGHIFRANSTNRFQVSTAGAVTTGNHTVTGTVYKNTSEELVAVATATPVATTSGTAQGITSLSGSVIRMLLNGVSTSGTDEILIQIGDSGGYETTGYTSSATNNTANTGGTSTAGFIVTNGTVAANAYNGVVTLTHYGSNTWLAEGTITVAGSGVSMSFSGIKTLSGTLDRVQITTTGGTDTFDAGALGAVSL